MSDLTPTAAGEEDHDGLDEEFGADGPHPDLLLLLRARLTNTEALAAGDHLAACRRCRDELADTAVGHAVLTRAGDTLPLGSATRGDDETLPALPPLAVPHRTGSRRRLGLAAAASVVLVAGTVGVTLGIVRDEGRPAGPGNGPGDSPGGGRALAVDLAPVTGAGSGDVRMVLGASADPTAEMTVHTDHLPAPAAGEFYQAWLLDPATDKMLALGPVGPSGNATFALSDALVEAYGAVDISLETDDGDPAHSVTSVLRGVYTT